MEESQREVHYNAWKIKQEEKEKKCKLNGGHRMNYDDSFCLDCGYLSPKNYPTLDKEITQSMEDSENDRVIKSTKLKSKFMKTGTTLQTEKTWKMIDYVAALVMTLFFISIISIPVTVITSLWVEWSGYGKLLFSEAISVVFLFFVMDFIHDVFLKDKGE